MFSIYTRDFVLKANIKNYKTLRWRRRYFEPGEFEIHALTEKKLLDNIAIDDIIVRRYSLECGIIESIAIKDNETIIYGRFLSSLLDRRITYNQTTVNDTSEKVMRKIVNDNCILSRPIPHLSLGLLNGFSELTDIQYTWKNVSSLLTKVSRNSGLGYRVIADIRSLGMAFEVYRGIDRSINQSFYPRVIFSVERNNLIDSEYVLSQISYKNVAVIGGEGEGSARIITSIDSGISGYDRREMFVDAKDIRQEELSQPEYEKLLLDRGHEKLAENSIFESFECDISLDGSLKYKENFDLGDIVTCMRKDWNKIINVRITEIEESINNGNVSLTAMLGSPFPSNEDLRKED